MPTYTITDPQTGRTMRVTGDSPPTEAELESLFGAEKPQARTWGDTLTDALPLAGGVVGGVVGAAGGIPGIMAGSAIGGGLGEAARQRFTQDEYDFGDIASTAIGEGATAGAFGLAGKGATRLIRGVQRAKISPRDIVTGMAKAPFTHGPIGAVKRSIEETSAARLGREALGSGNLKGRVEKLDDVLLEALEEARRAPAPTKIGGTGTPLRAKNNLPVVNAERTGDMISTQPDKWGATSIHRADDFVDRSRLVDKARPVMEPPPVTTPAPAATMADDAFGRYTRGDAQRQELLQELLKTQRELAAREGSGGHLTQAGRSMLSPEEEFRFQRALRIAR